MMMMRIVVRYSNDEYHQFDYDDNDDDNSDCDYNDFRDGHDVIITSIISSFNVSLYYSNCRIICITTSNSKHTLEASHLSSHLSL